MENRTTALDWWKQLPIDVRKYLANKYKPEWEWGMVDVTTWMIILIWGKEISTNSG